MDLLRSILENSEYTWLTAFILGLLTAVSPCPLATNISAIGFISRDIANQKRVFVHGLVYTLGRAITYIGLAVILYFGANQLNVALIFQGWGEKLIGPLLMIIGLFMLDVIKLHFPEWLNFTERMEGKEKKGYLNTLLLGIVFAMAFCPYSGVLYFAMLIPITIASASALYLPSIFAVGTGLPVIVFAWLLAFAVGNLANAYHNVKVFELWFRRIISVVFIGVGGYYTVQAFL
ncbi:MAG: aromatic aminobenezylarsenical efflux permease ArsG family transporter [Microbacter sp.]